MYTVNFKYRWRQKGPWNSWTTFLYATFVAKMGGIQNVWLCLADSPEVYILHHKVEHEMSLPLKVCTSPCLSPDSAAGWQSCNLFSHELLVMWPMFSMLSQEMCRQPYWGCCCSVCVLCPLFQWCYCRQTGLWLHYSAAVPSPEACPPGTRL